MADTALQVVVSPFLGVLFDNLSSFIQSETAQACGVTKQMEKLSKTLSTIKDVLGDAEGKQVTDNAIQNWLSELKDATYDADDLLDECSYEGLESASKKRGSRYTKVIDSVKQINFRRKIGKRLEDLRERFDEIAKRRSKFHLQKGNVESRMETDRERETSSVLTETEILGRDEDKEKLVKLVLNNATRQEDVSICPILGIGGLGKTTLTQLVYNDARVAEYFEARSWIYVSSDFDVKRIIKAIIVSLSRNSCDLEDLDPLQSRLEETLSGKRFLIVFDDLWNTNQEEWSKLKCSLRCGVKGSSIIVTTRLETVASITGTRPAYRLNLLSEDDCWDLFKERAFGLGNEEKRELVKIGKEIVTKCRGVPLAAKALGGLMRFKNEKNDWLFVRDTEIWDLPQSSENKILTALRLSYDHLPSHLRQCFAYCSIFPKGYEIDKENLIRLWMANDLIQCKGTMEFEDAGNGIFNDLLWRSFFQDMKRDKDGNIDKCKMHELVHDLACHVASDECSIIEVGKVKNIAKRTRHLSVGPISPDRMESTLHSAPFLRSLIMFGPWTSIAYLQSISSDHTRLRALDLSRTSAAELPSTIGSLIHLRYLNLTSSSIISLPESICRLRNLQTLYLRDCFALKILPVGMRKMCSLRHLDILGCNQLSKMPIGIGQLTCLQTLSIFIVGLEHGYGISELEQLNLGGELRIRELENVKRPTDAQKTLIRKQNFQSLQLSWSNSHLQENAADVIDGLQPHQNLRKLDIEGFQGVNPPSWFIASTLPNLVEVSLSNCRCAHLPSLGRLPYLKVLRICSMEYVKFIDEETYGENEVKGFPSLEELNLSSMPNLERWSSSQGGEGVLPRGLKSLCFGSCSKLTRVALRDLPCLSTLRIHWFDESQYFQEGTLQNLTALQSLWISHGTRLVSLPEEFRNLSALKTLVISDFPYLKYLRHLPPRLRRLNIWKCPEFEICTDDFQHLNCLEFLSLKGLPKLTYFPEGIKNATMLEWLSIQSDLMELPNWIGNLTSLWGLYLYDCKNLKALPEGMQHLNALRTLVIKGCHPELQARCKNIKGQDWYKISHIPEVSITSEA